MLLLLFALFSPSAHAAGYQHTFTSEPSGEVRALAVAPSGDVVAAVGTELQVRARHSGEVIEAVAVCPARQLMFVAPLEALVVCERDVRQVSFPGMKHRVVDELADVGMVAMNTKYLVVGHQGGVVKVYDAGDWSTVDRFLLGATLTGIAVDPTGTFVAVGGDDGFVTLRRFADRAIVARVKGNRDGTALAFSPDGTELFAQNTAAGAVVYSTADGGVVRQVAVGRGVHHASWLDATRVLAAGADGLHIYPKGSPRVPLGYARSASGVIVAHTDDGEIVCTADASGRIACFASRPIEPSAYLPAGSSSGPM